MPLLFNKTLNSTTGLALWNITESPEELLKKLNCAIDSKILLVNEQLKKQRIVSRILTNMLCFKPCVEISYDVFNKPHLVNCDAKISISHAHNRVVVIINKQHETGIDIELIKPKIVTISTRFMSNEELEQVDVTRKEEQLTTYWCAKEALYKYYGKKELLFREHISVEPFKQENSGCITGSINKENVSIRIQLQYEKFGEYMMVYVND